MERKATWPRWFRYGVMKEASPVWHEVAMRIDSTVAARGQWDGTFGGEML